MRTCCFAALLLIATLQAPAAARAAGTYHAQLSGRNELPAPGIETAARGEALFKLSRDGRSVHYRIVVSNLTDPTMAHIHFGRADEVGGLVAWLFPSPRDAAPPVGRVDGILIEGTLVASDLTGRLFGRTIDDLVSLIESGGAYVNVHTVQHPAGEMRGQLEASH